MGRREDGAAVREKAGDAALSSHRVGPETVRLMRRPRAGLVTLLPGGPAQPPAGMKTGCPSGLHAAETKEAAGAAPDQEPKGAPSLPGSAAQGTEIAAQWSAGRRVPPIARGNGTLARRPTGWLRRSPIGSFARSRVCRRSAPLFGSAMRNGNDGSPGAGQRTRAMTHVCAEIVPRRLVRAME